MYDPEEHSRNKSNAYKDFTKFQCCDVGCHNALGFIVLVELKNSN